MDLTPTSYHVRSSSQQDVAAAIRSVVRKHAFVTNAINGWVTVFDMESDDLGPPELRRLAAGVSACCGVQVIALQQLTNGAMVVASEGGRVSFEHAFTGDSYPADSDPAEGLVPFVPDGTPIEKVRDRLRHAYRHDPQGQVGVVAILLGIDASRAEVCFSEVVEKSMGDPRLWRGLTDVRGTFGW